jgi:hypothetical protein
MDSRGETEGNGPSRSQRPPMTTSFSLTAPFRAPDRWTLDPAGCHLLLVLSPARSRSIPVSGIDGWLELREGDFVGSRLSIRLPPDLSEDAGLLFPGGTFRGSAVRLGADDEMEIDGRLSVGDRMDPFTLIVVPTLYHRRGDTEYLDLDVSGHLPRGRCGDSRLEGRLRVLRATRAA